MARFSWELKLCVVLIAISIAIYTLKFFIFGSLTDTANYIFNSLGFLPVSALLVTIILNKLLTVRQKRERLEQMNMVIGTFFSEVGNYMLSYYSTNDRNIISTCDTLVPREDWENIDFSDAIKKIETIKCEISLKPEDLYEIKKTLSSRREFLLRLLENPILLEHALFTELLRATFHLAEELDNRDDIMSLPQSDIDHLSGDVTRVYQMLIRQWLEYMKYLKVDYPYLFSLAMRTNPFDDNCSAIVR